MLTDIELSEWDYDPTMRSILNIVGGTESSAKKLDKMGLYSVSHFNFNHLLQQGVIIDEWPHFDELGAYGVCDSPEQFMKKVGEIVEKDPRRLVVSFVEVRKADQPSDGGWRWHKWGEYIGEQNRKGFEYLYDEPEVEVVFCYHILHLVSPGKPMERIAASKHFKPYCSFYEWDRTQIVKFLEETGDKIDPSKFWWKQVFGKDKPTWECMEVM